MNPSTTLRQALAYEPVELEFGTSGLRGLVKDITDLEAYVATRAFLQFLRGSGKSAPAEGGEVCIAGDLRPSTSAIFVPVLRAIADEGFTAVHLGRIPSPALLFFSRKRGAPSAMVTGSHIPFDRNGIKLNRADGEVRKSDEGPIRGNQKRLREAEYKKPLRESMFDESGALRASLRPSLPPVIPNAADAYVRRYTEAFPAGILSGRTILVYQHSAVGRDLLADVLRRLGARVIPAGRSESFVPVDTEAVNAEMMQQIQGLVDENAGTGAPDAVVSTDGDSDRPLVLGVEHGRVRFYPGDILGIVTAEFLGAREIAVPVSVNDAVDLQCAVRGVTLLKTRIGSPYVIDAMKEVGWEANGGFLTARPVSIPGGGTLEALPTRDALLPILAALSASLGAGMSLEALFSQLPPRYGKSGLLREFPRERALAILRRLSPRDSTVLEARLDPQARWTITRGGAGGAAGSRSAVHASGPVSPTDALAAELDAIGKDMTRFFPREEGFSSVAWINWLDGVRVGFDNGDIAHIRPSGNAPEMRVYAAAATPERAAEIVSWGTGDNGFLRRLGAAVEEQEVIDRFRADPGVLGLQGTVQRYAWGGFVFIPSLLGEPDPGQAPYAELWIGAHPLAPSRVFVEGRAVSLDALVQHAPRQVLGDRDAKRFSGRFPFLMKVLDARVMLSIQAHPTRKQAAEGFARENAAGVPLDAPQRNYRDDNHKPELHVALTDFWLLHGFRPLEEIAALPAQVPELGQALRLPRKPGEKEPLRALYTALMTMPQAEVDGVLCPLVERLARQERSPGLDKDSPDFWALRAARELPLPGGRMDRGIFSIYLLNLIHLRPGEGTFQPAGTLHAYLEGTTMEVMASSDNVLRGGLTPKTVDTDELLRIVSFADGRPAVLTGRALPGFTRYEAPAEEFLLDRVETANGERLSEPGAHGAECCIVMEGSVRLASGNRTLELSRGKAALVPSGIPYDIEPVSPRAVLFRARVPEPGPGAA